MDFLTTYLKYCEPLQGSELWHLWAGISILTAALERKCWRDHGEQKIYPNMYITLNGNPGSGKTFSSVNAMLLVERLNDRMRKLGKPGIQLPTDKLTPASLIKQMGQAKKGYKTSSGPRVEYHSLFSHAAELSSFIVDIGGGSITHDLLHFFDAPKLFRKHIVTGPLMELHNISFSCLWDTTPAFLSRYLPKESAGDGLSSRILFITDLENHRFPRVPPQVDTNLRDTLDKLFERVYNMVGLFKETPDAAKFMNKWHTDTWFEEKATIRGHGNFLQYHARKPLHLNRLCMISAASRGSQQITLEDAERALGWLSQAESGMKRAFGVQNANKNPDACYQLLNYIPYEGIYEDKLVRTMMDDGVVYPQDFVWESFIRTLTVGNCIKVLNRKNDKRFFIKVNNEPNK